MPPLTWDAPGDRKFELGLDRGVIYIGIGDNTQAYAWNGLISVTTRKPMREMKSFYLDGVQIFQYIGGEDYEAVIEAYTYPDIVNELEGTTSINPGLAVSGQTIKPFTLSYRTMKGDGINGINAGYKLHFVYNITMTPNDKKYSTLTDSYDPSIFSWTLRAIPIPVPSGPSNPENPGYPSPPLYPGDPGYPYQPGDPGYGDPFYPDDPLNPGDPGYPYEPGDPGYGDPVYPGDPDYPYNPDDPSYPGIPDGPGMPGDPSFPGDPDFPGYPDDPGIIPSPEVIIDQPGLPPGYEAPIDDIIYGPPEGPGSPYLPTPDELIDWTDPVGPGPPGYIPPDPGVITTIVITDIGDGTWTAEGPESNIIDWGDGTFDIDDVDATFDDEFTYTVTTTELD